MNISTRKADLVVSFLQSAESELIKELHAGRNVEELAAEESSGDLSEQEIAWGLRSLLERHPAPVVAVPDPTPTEPAPPPADALEASASAEKLLDTEAIAFLLLEARSVLRMAYQRRALDLATDQMGALERKVQQIADLAPFVPLQKTHPRANVEVSTGTRRHATESARSLLDLHAAGSVVLKRCGATSEDLERRASWREKVMDQIAEPHMPRIAAPWHVSIYRSDGTRVEDLTLESGTPIRNFSMNYHPIRGSYSGQFFTESGSPQWVYSHEAPRFSGGL